MKNIFSIEKSSSFSSDICVLRFLLSMFVIFSHIIPWYEFYGIPVNSISKQAHVYITKFFQGSGETNPAVIAFIVLSGYCIHRNGLRIGSVDIRPLAKLASDREVEGDLGAQNRSVFDIHEDLSTKSTHQLSAEVGFCKRSIKGFFIRRLFRILPIFLIGILLGILAYSYFGADAKIKAITGTQEISIIGALLKLTGLHSFIPNALNISYQGNAALVTCAVEIWLYVAYPILMIFIIQKGEKLFWLLLSGITLLGATLYTIIPQLEPWWHNGSFFGFLIYWWIGVFCVDRTSKILSKTKIITCAYLILSCALILHPKLFLIVELRKILFAALVGILLNKLDKYSFTKIPFGKSFIDSGYSIYALHTPIIVFALAHEINVMLAVCGILLTSWICYKYIEKPFTQLGKKLSNQNSSSKILKQAVC